MKDYTLDAYKTYLELIRDSGFNFILFREYLQEDYSEGKICLVRHDVDRKPQNSLEMAELESGMGIRSTYYFRIKKNVFKRDIIRKIESLGHEIGYHYENLSDCDGDLEKGFEDFTQHLSSLREVADIKTISMHGRPLKPYDNRDLWRNEDYHSKLADLGILGELYLDIDYSKFAYINDTGRNWSSGKHNRRDKVASDMDADFETQTEMMNYLGKPAADRLVFQIHPERWSNNPIEWRVQREKDRAINIAKVLIKAIGS